MGVVNIRGESAFTLSWGALGGVSPKAPPVFSVQTPSLFYLCNRNRLMQNRLVQSKIHFNPAMQELGKKLCVALWEWLYFQNKSLKMSSEQLQRILLFPFARSLLSEKKHLKSWHDCFVFLRPTFLPSRCGKNQGRPIFFQKMLG